MATLSFNKLKRTDAIWLPNVPEHWEMVKVRHLFKESTKKGFPHEPLLVASQKDGVVSKDAYGKRTVEATKDLHNLKLVEQGDFVISLRSFQGGIEFAHERGIISPAYTIIKETRQIEKRYFKNLFKSPPFISLMTLCVKGIREGQNIDYPTFKNEYLPFPPIDEQQAIAAYLDKKNIEIDQFIRNKKRLIDLLKLEKDNLTKNLVTRGVDENSSFSKTNIYWIKEIPTHWEVIPFKVAFKENKKRNDFKEDYSVLSLSYGNIVFKDHDSNMGLVPMNYDSYQIINPETLVFRFTDLQNDHKSLRVGLSKNKGIITSAYLSVVKQLKIKLSMDYAYLLLHSYDIDKVFYQFGGGVRQAIGFPDVKQLPILLPPIEEQNKIVAEQIKQTNKINSLIAKAEQEVLSIKEYREALITDLVTGKRSVSQLQMN